MKTTQITIKEIAQHGNIDEKLIRAVIAQHSDKGGFFCSASDIANYGASGGVSGFIYYTDTCKFYARHRELIKEVASEMANSFGQGIIEMIQGFNCLGTDYSCDEIGQTLYGPKSEHSTQVANALAWFALEEVARLVNDYFDENGITPEW